MSIWKQYGIILQLWYEAGVFIVIVTIYKIPTNFALL